MWHSEDDIIKDLASLNDFGAPGDTEPYKVLYFNGRGSKRIQKSHKPKTFVDPRNGDVLDLTGVTHDTQNIDFGGSRGRGSTLGKLARKNTQLQNQLRVARPLGSSDVIIETYLRKNQPPTAKPSKLEPLSKENTEENRTSPNSFLNNCDETKRRVKSVRGSSSQSNALLTSLLSKVKCEPDSKSITVHSDVGSDDKISLNNEKTIESVNRDFGIETNIAPGSSGEMSDSNSFEQTLNNGFSNYDSNNCSYAAKLHFDKASSSLKSEEFVLEAKDFPSLKKH